MLVDLGAGAQAATRHLLDAGHRRVAFVTTICEPGESRCDAYTAVMQGAGLPAEYIPVERLGEEHDRAAAYRTVGPYVREHGCPDALFCQSDESAAGTLRALHDLGVRVPEDVALVGCDGIEEMEYHLPRLSTILFPFGEAARLGWEFLRRRIEDPSLPLQSATLLPRLAVRESSVPSGGLTARGLGPHGARALRRAPWTSRPTPPPSLPRTRRDPTPG